MDAAADFPLQAWMPSPRARAKTTRSRSELTDRSSRGSSGATTTGAGGLGGTSPQNRRAAWMRRPDALRGKDVTRRHGRKGSEVVAQACLLVESARFRSLRTLEFAHLEVCALLEFALLEFALCRANLLQSLRFFSCARVALGLNACTAGTVRRLGHFSFRAFRAGSK